MSKTTPTTAAPTTSVYEVGHLYEVDPCELKIGANVRVDTHPDAKDFAASVRTRGVLEVISAYLDDEGGLTVLRGQRRALVAVKVGTPSGTVPIRVVPAPDEADRIVDQMSENLHREGMNLRETRDGIEQLAILGVSAAQIAKRTALPRPLVDTTLTVVANPATKERMDSAGMTLEDAAIFAEFEDDPAALDTLTQAWDDPWRRRQIAHIVQGLRDDRAEAHALRAEVERLRAEGLPVLDPQDVPEDLYRHSLARLCTEDGTPVPEEQWPGVAGAAVAVTVEWVNPDDENTGGEDDGTDTEDTDTEDEDYRRAEPVQVYVPVWVCTDPDAAGLRDGSGRHALRTNDDGDSGTESEQEWATREAEDDARREAESAERRRVIAYNKAWKAAEVVRREWMAGLLGRRTVPAGAESLIAQAVIGREYSLSHALQHGHSLLPDLLGVKAVEDDGPAYYGNRATCARIIEQAATPKAATMRTLAAVLAAWEERSGVHTWRNPGAWDAAVMGALVGWGYPASEVEQLLIPTRDAQDAQKTHETGSGDGQPAQR